MGLSVKEEAVLSLIQSDPFLTQAQLAESLLMNRSTLASVISSLTQKGYLKGRAYILNESPEIFCIGAMNLDRIFQLKEDMLLSTSNPITSSVTVGGVARNVAENLGRLGLNVKLLSLAGNDSDYEHIKTHTQPYVSLDPVQLLNDHATSSYTAILDPKGQMQVAFADMAICDLMNDSWIHEFHHQLSHCQMIAMDLNLTLSGVSSVIQLAKAHQIPLIVIPVSGPKMRHLPHQLEGVEWMIVNQDESEEFFNVKVENDQDFEDLAHRWLKTKVAHVVITRGTDSLLYANQQGDLHYYQPIQSPNVVDVTGAGDSFVAGLIYGINQSFSADEAIHLGLTNSYHTVQSHSTVRPNLHPDGLLNERNQLGNCLL